MRYRFIGLICLLSFYSCSSPGAKEGGPAVEGQMAPNFTFEDQSGKQFSLSDFRGKVVLINFWATWCPPCRDEMPSMNHLQQQIGNNHLAILALSVDESWNEVDQFLRQSGFTLPVYADFDKKISTLYGTFKFPETYVLDKTGKVVLKVIGPADWIEPQMLSFLSKLTAESSS